jgi:hypothetical protein
MLDNTRERERESEREERERESVRERREREREREREYIMGAGYYNYYIASDNQVFHKQFSLVFTHKKVYF